MGYYNNSIRIGGAAVTKQELQQRIGKNIARLRYERKLTQDYVAEKAGISTTHFANLECGNKSPTVLTLYKISDVLGASMDAIIQDGHEDSRVTVIANLLRNQSDETVEFIEKLVRVCVSELPDSIVMNENHGDDSSGVKSW